MFGTALKFITLTFMYISTEQPVQKKHFTCINYQVRRVFFSHRQLKVDSVSGFGLNCQDIQIFHNEIKLYLWKMIFKFHRF